MPYTEGDKILITGIEDRAIRFVGKEATIVRVQPPGNTYSVYAVFDDGEGFYFHDSNFVLLDFQRILGMYCEKIEDTVDNWEEL